MDFILIDGSHESWELEFSEEELAIANPLIDDLYNLKGGLLVVNQLKIRNK